MGKPLSFACPYAGCLRGSNDKKEDEEAKDGFPQITKIWNEANEHPIDRENQRDLVKHFVASVMSDNLQKFDQTTKRLQRRYKKMSESGTQNAQKYEPNGLQAVLGNDDALPQQEEAQNAGPRSMWN